MASTSGRDRRPDALSRLNAAPAPWIGRGDPVAGDTAEVGSGDTRVLDNRSTDNHATDNGIDTDPPASRAQSNWGPSTAPRWLDADAPDLDDTESAAGQSDGRDRPRRPRAPGRALTVAPPAAIALIAVGVLACIVTAYTVLRGPSDDSPSAARVAFPASAGKAAPSGSIAATAESTTGAGGETATPRLSTRPATPDELVVSVVGLVRTPGLVRLSGAARVADAIDRAGGGRAGADLLSLNMAQPLRDGDQILVGFADPAGGKGMRSAIVSADSSGAAASGAGGGAGAVPTASGAAGSASATGAGAPVNLNTADEAALDTLPGVGPVTAKAIIDWRSRNGRFTSVDQLGEVDGIGPGRLAKLRDRVTV